MGVVSRFLAEARAVNIIRHPGIVDIYELAQLPGGAPYIVMEYLSGQPLSERLVWCGGRLGPVLLSFVRQIASALAAAHRKGIVHRDIRPDNVMIVSDSEMPSGERAKVVDFGIARFATRLGMCADPAGLLMPAELGTLGKLLRLDISGNKITDLPPELGQLSHSLTLDTHGNPLTSVPPRCARFAAGAAFRRQIMKFAMETPSLSAAATARCGLASGSCALCGFPMMAAIIRCRPDRDCSRFAHAATQLARCQRNAVMLEQS